MNDAEAIARAIGIRRRQGKATLTWFGERVDGLYNPLLPDRLASIVYTHAYILGAPMPLDTYPDHGSDPVWNDLKVGAHLKASWSGWTRVGDDRLAFPGQPLLSVGPLHGEVSGDAVSVTIPAMSGTTLPGWMLVRHGDTQGMQAVVRLYANTYAHRARELVDQLGARLIEEGYTGFAMKFLMARNHTDRADSSVLYLPEYPNDALLHSIIELLQPAIASQAVPMFTCKVSPGIALAHNPTDGESFGQLRCRQTAQALVHASRHRSRLTLPFDSSAPWNLDGKPRLKFRRPLAKPRTSRRGTACDPEVALDRLAARVQRSAIVSNHLATWLVRDPATGRVNTAGADVYAGSAGALLLFAHAVGLGEGRYLPTLRATARAMQRRQQELPTLGFHSGQPGTAAVLAEAAVTVDDDELLSIARDSLNQARCAPTTTRGWDLLSGLAGSILGLGAASDFLNVDVSSELIHLQRSLHSLAEHDVRTGGARWRSTVGRRRPALAGLAHGGSGAAVALATQHRPGAPIPDLVWRAVRFEDGSRQTSRGWVDWRQPGSSEPATAWCHGAAGIGIASAALCREYGQPLRARARLAAVRTREALTGGSTDLGLCHGTSGKALAVGVIAKALGQPELCDDIPTEFERSSWPTR